MSYSTFARLPGGRFGLNYERGGVIAFVFATFSLERLDRVYRPPTDVACPS